MTTIASADGLELEAAWTSPTAEVRGVVVFCHPHPLQGGTMNAPLMKAVTGVLADAGLWVLRFNFRGVGASEGAWGEGIGEIEDVAGAMEAATATRPDDPIAVAGWSFGAATALHWQARTGSTLPYAGIAPPVEMSTGGRLPDPESLQAASRAFVIGDRDQFTTVDDLTEYAEAAGAVTHVVPGSDHFFYFREQVVGAHLADHLRSALEA